jgi:hypothetical protein
MFGKMHQEICCTSLNILPRYETTKSRGGWGFEKQSGIKDIDGRVVRWIGLVLERREGQQPLFHFGFGAAI